MNQPPSNRPLLAMDTASPTVSVALGRRGEPHAVRSIALRRSSENLLQMVDDLLSEAELSLRDLAGVIALRGPGSFTGVRVGLATALGFHQAIGLPATGLPSLSVLAKLAIDALVDDSRRAEPSFAETGRDREDNPVDVIAVADALRGQWFAQSFALSRAPARDQPTAAPVALGEPSIADPQDLIALRPRAIVGFGVSKLAGLLPTDETPSGPADEAPPAIRLIEPQQIAGAALDLAFSLDLDSKADRSPSADWNPDLLIEPLYLRQPFITPSRQAQASDRRSETGE